MDIHKASIQLNVNINWRIILGTVTMTIMPWVYQRYHGFGVVAAFLDVP